MAKILEVYGSTTGNTESIAHALEAKLQEAGNDVTVINAADAQADGLADGYDAVLFGASCWGDEDIEMQEDFAALFENADKMNLKGKKIAAFASGDRSYPHFCGAVDIVEEAGKKLGAEIITDGLRIEGDGSDCEDDIASWADDIAKAV